MKTTIVIILCLVGTRCLSQSFYLKLNEYQAATRIRNTEGRNVQISKTYLDDGSFDLTWEGDIWQGILYFNEYSTSALCCIIPRTPEVLNTMVENFNKNQVKISDTEWRVYNGDGVFRVKLLYAKQFDKYVFYASPSRN